jgi:hypothetical protein
VDGCVGSDVDGCVGSDVNVSGQMWMCQVRCECVRSDVNNVSGPI